MTNDSSASATTPPTLDGLPVWEAFMAPGGLRDMLFDRPPWMADAACREHPEVTFMPPPPHTGTRPTRHERAAMAVCRSCLVRAECLAYALDGGELGVWGGTTERGRRQMRREGVA